MPKSDEKVMQLVEQALEKKPDASVDELYEQAKAAHPSIGKLTHRQFNARYPLQVKRRRSLKADGGSSRRRSSRSRRRKSSVSGDQREKIRGVLTDFASDVVGAANEPKNLVSVIADVDRYVDRLLEVLPKR